MKLAECKGQWALVTGASSGIGREFAIELAEAGMHLVLVARRKNLLDALAAELIERHSICVVPLSIDLTVPDAAREVHARVAERDIRIRLLCNNAAFGRWGHFEATTPDVYEQMLHLNVGALIGLCSHFLPDLSSFPTSVVINLSSPAGLQPVPYMAVYAATKSFVHAFSQALYGEWRTRGVLVQTLVPGPTATEFDAIAGAYSSAIKERATPQEAVTAALRHLGTDKPVVTSAKGLYRQRLFSGLFPAKTVIATVGKMFAPPTTKP